MRNRLSRHWFCTAAPRPWLFVGLGKPGDKYKGTRHNVGFEMIDAFAESQGIAMDTVHCKAIFGQGFVGDIPVFLAKPQTYMNLSGESAFYHVLPQRLEQLVHNLYFLTKLQTGPLGAYYKLPLNRVLVVAMVSILWCFVFMTKEVMEATMGIGRPPGQMDPKAFLLQKFNRTARERLGIVEQD
nr:peptidyl-tRNA hydrolase, mitochondrial isoform X14 [Ziziphus jujuba var. spinosa]